MSTDVKRKCSQSGVTLIELIVFIVIVSVSLAGVLKALEVANRDSVDPLIRKQALSIAESLLQEIEQQPFTFCDPDDPIAVSAASTAECTSSQDKGGAALSASTPTTESRYDGSQPFDNVADYGGFNMPGSGCMGICLPGNSTPLAGLAGYAANVAVTRVGASSPFAAMPLDAVLKIVVTVTGPANTTVSMTGYRVRYAPNI